MLASVQKVAPSENLLALIARRMRVLAEPSRMRILYSLERHEATVQELADELSLPHQNVSKHLNVLYQAGITSRVRDGSCLRYSIADYTVFRIIQQAQGSVTGYIEELSELANPE